MSFFRGFIKSVFDYVTVIFFIPFWVPLLIVLAVIIKVCEPAYPVFFLQTRIGKNGIPFKMIKFRSMIPNRSSNTITSKNDKRITRLGSFLRKRKLDELPELLNILNGTMSLVGPRPDVPGYADNLKGEDRLVLKLRPGITGPASLKYSNEEELLARMENPKWYNDNVIFPDKIKINLNYYHNHNLWLDITLIFQTIFGK
jgi:lipopolysaccharide/colanic/teichoic acid biosynthesis glycosyltransferase